MTSCIYQTVVQAFTSNSVWNLISQQADQALVNQQSGVGSVLFWLAIGIGFLIILGIIGGIIFAVIKGKQDKPAAETPTKTKTTTTKVKPAAPVKTTTVQTKV